MDIGHFYWNEYERRECSKWGKTALDVFAEMNMSETNVQAKRTFKMGKKSETVSLVLV